MNEKRNFTSLALSCPSPLVGHRFAVLPGVFERGAFVVCGNAIVFVSPVAEVNQLAAFGTEGAMRVVFHLDGFVAVRTLLLHKTFGERERGKGERKKPVQT